MLDSVKEKRWGIIAIVLGFLVGFLSAYLCIIWHLVIFGFNIMYIVSPLIAGFVETIIANRKYGKSTGAISALLTFLLINIYGWFLPGYYVDPTKEPATLSIITLIAIALTIQAAFPILVNYIILVVVVGTFTRIIEFLVSVPSKIQGKQPEVEEKEEIIGPSADEVFLDELTIPLVSVPDVNGGKIKKYLGLVIGEAVTEKREPKGRFSKLLKIIQPTQLEELNLGEAKKKALSRMLEKAESMGANGVIEVLIDFISMGGLQGSATIVTASGTAVIVQGETRDSGEKEFREGPNSETDKETNISDLIEKISGPSERTSKKDEEIKVPDITEKTSEPEERTWRMGEETKGKIGYTIRDDLSDPIEQYLIDIKKQLLKDHEIVTKNEVGELEMRFSKVSKDLEDLDKKFEGDKEYTNTKIDEIEHRLEKLETSKKNTWKPRNINLKSN